MTIKKIDIPQSTVIDTSVLWGGINDNVLAAKINELIDVVNELQKHEEQHLDLLTQLNEMRLQNTKKAEPADPYAEQRKWIGCICRFWYDNPNDTLLDYLDKIQTGKNGVVQYYSKESGDWFSHCEPVLPTDNAIYKGDDND